MTRRGAVTSHKTLRPPQASALEIKSALTGGKMQVKDKLERVQRNERHLECTLS